MYFWLLIPNLRSRKTIGPVELLTKAENSPRNSLKPQSRMKKLVCLSFVESNMELIKSDLIRLRESITRIQKHRVLRTFKLSEFTCKLWLVEIFVLLWCSIRNSLNFLHFHLSEWVKETIWNSSSDFKTKFSKTFPTVLPKTTLNVKRH